LAGAGVDADGSELGAGVDADGSELGAGVDADGSELGAGVDADGSELGGAAEFGAASATWASSSFTSRRSLKRWSSSSSRIAG